MRPFVLVLAGRDPSGGAGVDADREAIRGVGDELGPIDVACVVTAETDQDAGGVRAVAPVEPGEWVGEARAALAAHSRSELALKVGLLPSVEAILACASLLREVQKARSLRIVLDPVIESSSGYVFLDEACRRAVIEELLPLGPIVTPNLLEAAQLFETELQQEASSGSPAGLGWRASLARVWIEHGASAVVLKGGHGQEDPVHDLLLEGSGEPCFSTHARVPGGIRGSGCRFASALAAHLASGTSLALAVRAAGELVADRIADASRLP